MVEFRVNFRGSARMTGASDTTQTIGLEATGSQTASQMDAADRLLLLRAVELAVGGMFSVTANPRVGCVLVKDGQLLGRGFHQRGGDAHAEVNALRSARERYSALQIAGATAYVSLEPCCHVGRTAPCTEALIEAGISRVVVAMLDPHPKVAGQGVQRLRDAGIRVDVAQCPEAWQLNYGHNQRMLTARPYVRLKIAQSFDGRTAMASGESKWITGPVARQDVQYWRARSGAVITGVGTVQADDPALTVRDKRFAVEIEGETVLRQPLRVVLDSHRRASSEARLFTDGQPTLWVVGPHADAHPMVAPSELLVLAGGTEAVGGSVPRPDIDALLLELGRRGCNEVLVEAGAQLVGEFLRRDIWDEILVYSAPRLLGSDARPMADLALTTLSRAIEAKIAATDQLGTDVRTRLVRTGRDLRTLDCVPLGVPDGFFDGVPEDQALPTQ